MKTIEQIASEHGLCRCNEAYKIRNLTDPDCPLHSSDVFEAMKDYAIEALKEAAGRAIYAARYKYGFEVEQSILSLINELK